MIVLCVLVHICVFEVLTCTVLRIFILHTTYQPNLSWVQFRSMKKKSTPKSSDSIAKQRWKKACHRIVMDLAVVKTREMLLRKARNTIMWVCQREREKVRKREREREVDIFESLVRWVGRRKKEKKSIKSTKKI